MVEFQWDFFFKIHWFTPVSISFGYVCSVFLLMRRVNYTFIMCHFSDHRGPFSAAWIIFFLLSACVTMERCALLISSEPPWQTGARPPLNNGGINIPKSTNGKVICTVGWGIFFLLLFPPLQFSFSCRSVWLPELQAALCCSPRQVFFVVLLCCLKRLGLGLKFSLSSI